MHRDNTRLRTVGAVEYVLDQREDSRVGPRRDHPFIKDKRLEVTENQLVGTVVKLVLMLMNSYVTESA
jgi:hypothetical protein